MIINWFLVWNSHVGQKWLDLWDQTSLLPPPQNLYRINVCSDNLLFQTHCEYILPPLYFALCLLMYCTYPCCWIFYFFTHIPKAHFLLFTHSFIFIQIFALIRVMTDPESIPGTLKLIFTQFLLITPCY